MDDSIVERIFAIGIEVGVINLAKQLGLIDDNLTDAQAYKIHTKKTCRRMETERVDSSLSFRK